MVSAEIIQKNLLVFIICEVTLHVLGEKTVAEIRRAAFDFEHSFSCPQEVLVNETFKCTLTVRGANTVQATVQWEDRPPYNQEFAEANRVSLGVPSLKDYKNVGSTCKLPAQLIYGPITSRRAALHTVWFMSNNGSIRLTHRHLKCHTGYVADYEENRCSDGSRAQVVSLHTGNFSSTRPGVARFEIDPGWDMSHGDVIEVTTGDTLKCVNTGTPKLEAAIQLDFANPNVVEFAGAFVTEGTHFVIAALESYAWEQLAPPKLIKLPIRVLPPQMKAAAVLDSTESPIATTGGQLSERGTDLGRIVGFRFSFLGGNRRRMRFSIEATKPFHGTVEVNGTNFQGTFVSTCRQTSGPCLLVVYSRNVRTGKHHVCASAVADNGQSSVSCLAVEITGRQGKLELYVDGEGAPLNGQTILRTRPIYGDYDPSLIYFLHFGDGSSPVAGTNLDENVLFVHTYTTEGKFTASMEFRDGARLTCEVAVAHPIDTVQVDFPNGPIALVRKSITGTVRVVSNGSVSIQVGGKLLINRTKEIRSFTIIPLDENVHHINATAYNLGFSKTVPITYQGQLNNFQIGICLQSNTSSTLLFKGAVEFLNYTGSRSVPLGFRLSVECGAVKNALAVAQIVYLRESDKSFHFSLPHSGQFECTFAGQNDVWKTQPKTYTLTATLPLILGGIGVSAQVGAQSVTGCGKSYNVFDQFTSVTLNVDIIQGKAEEILWHLENLSNLNVYFERRKGNAKTIANSHLDVGHYAVMASVNGREAGSSQSMRFFQIVDTEQLPDYCKQYPPKLIDSCFTKWPFPETLPFRLHFQILHETGNFHRVQWNKQKACLSPRLIVNPLLKKKGQQEPVATFYMNLTLPMQGGTIDVEEEDGDICLPQTELKANSLYEATIYVNDSLMIDRETHKILLDGIVDTPLSIRIVRPLSAIETHSVTSFEYIVLSGVCGGFDCPQAAKRQWYVKAIYVDGSSWWLDDEEMNRFTQGRNTSTIIIAPELLLQLPEYTQLSTCLSPTRLSPDTPDVCVILAIKTPIPCNRCVLQSPSILQDFQHVNASCSCPSAKGKFEFYAKTPDGEMTISVSEKPRFSSILPRLEGGIETCIRSLPGSNVYINTCFQTLQFVPVMQEDLKNLLRSIASGKLDILDNAVASGQPSVIFRIVHTISTQVTALMKSDFSEGSLECFNHTRNQAAKLLDKLVTALENISVTDGETLLSMTSAIEALAANAKEVAFPTVERIQSRLAQVARVLPDILAASSRDNVLTVGHRFLHIGLHLLEGMSHQHASPTPYLRDRAPQSLDYDTDIDSPPLNRVDQLITRNLQEDQRKAATSMVGTLENINAALAQALQDILVPGGDPLQVTSSTIGTVCFARAGMGISACGGTEFSVQISDGRFPIGDGVIQASRLRRNFYDFFNDEHLGPQSNLVSLTLYVNGRAINMSNTSSSFVITLKKDENVSSSIGIEEQHLTLPDPVVGVDGSLVYQPLILHRFDVGNTENTFVFQLHPTDIGACPQYLVAVRFVIPPNLRFDDGLGRYLWSMIPSSTTKCKPNGNGEEVLLNYAYYIDREVLVELKAEALKQTAHMKLRAEELSVLYIGYRQLTAEELDRYNSENPPPVPYPYIDQINNTARVSAFLPSCLHLAPGGAGWRKDGCKVLPSSNLDEVACECTHLTTFGAASLHASLHADFPYITDITDLTHFSICHTITDISITFVCILIWHITGQIYKNQQILNLCLLTMAVCLQIVALHEGIHYIGKTSTLFVASTLLYNWLSARFGSNSVQISLKVHSN